MQYCSGAIPKAKVVIATTGLVWEQKAHMHSALRVRMEQVDILVGEEAQQDMDLKSAFVPAIPRQPFLRLLFGDPKQSPGGVADNLRERRALLLKATKVMHSVPKVDHKQLLLTPCADIPAKSKLLRTEAKQGAFLCVFGVCHSPEQFVTVSRSLKHPFDDLIQVPDLLLQCIFDFSTLGPLEVSKRRIHTLLK